MTTPLFPGLPGLAWSVTKAPNFATRKQQSVSGRVLRLLDQSVPIWTFTLTWEFLRDANDTRGNGLSSGYDELRSLGGFFLQQQGSFLPFLFNDPTDNIVTGQAIATGDGATTAFQLVRRWGLGLGALGAGSGFAEPVLAPNVVSAVYLNGVVQGGGAYSVNFNTGILTFTGAPGNGVAITADFTYYFRCFFADDMAEYENFMLGLWSLKQLKFTSDLG